MPRQVTITELEWSHQEGEKVIDQGQALNLKAEDPSAHVNPYLYLKAKVTDSDQRDIDIDIRLKFDDDGLVVDIFDNIAKKFKPLASTWVAYNYFYTLQEVREEEEAQKNGKIEG